MEELHCPCSENEGSDQLRSYCEADLRLCFSVSQNLVSHDAAHMSSFSRVAI